MTVAYFSMEVGLDAPVRTYGGGLGILAGDMLRTAADFGLPMVGVTLLYRSGNYQQHLDAEGNQTESERVWEPERLLIPLLTRATVTIEGRAVQIGVWEYRVEGMYGATVPVYFLDTALPENDPKDQALTDQLYAGDARHRLCQEVVLGLGGMAMLEALGYGEIDIFHMNEGHAALLGLALLERVKRGAARDSDIDKVRSRCVFTTHTPVPAGHDRFPSELVLEVLGTDRSEALFAVSAPASGVLNMTHVALRFSRYVNGVSLKHEEVTAEMFPQYRVDSVTNGVHAVTWTAPPLRDLYDSHIPEWRQDNHSLRHAINIPIAKLRDAHEAAKEALLAEVEARTGVSLDRDVLTLGLARRAAAYKRMGLLFAEPDVLRRITREAGPLQILCAGKAHPQDEQGKDVIRDVFKAARLLAPDVLVLYLEDYDMDLAALLVSGVDLWVNTPERPMEASGTSGMKAAMNAVPSFSTLDGWWVEGHIEDGTGWVIEEDGESDAAVSLYRKLEHRIIPMFYERPNQYLRVMRQTVALNGSFFNSQRMLDQYVRGAYFASNPVQRAGSARVQA